MGDDTGFIRQSEMQQIDVDMNDQSLQTLDFQPMGSSSEDGEALFESSKESAGRNRADDNESLFVERQQQVFNDHRENKNKQKHILIEE